MCLLLIGLVCHLIADILEFLLQRLLLPVAVLLIWFALYLANSRLSLKLVADSHSSLSNFKVLQTSADWWEVLTDAELKEVHKQRGLTAWKQRLGPLGGQRRARKTPNEMRKHVAEGRNSLKNSPPKKLFVRWSQSTKRSTPYQGWIKNRDRLLEMRMTCCIKIMKAARMGQYDELSAALFDVHRGHRPEWTDLLCVHSCNEEQSNRLIDCR